MAKNRKQSAVNRAKSKTLTGIGGSLSRRALLKSAVGAAVGATAAGFASGLGVRAQVQGLYTSNEPPEIPLSLGSLTYLDRKQYIHNMEIISHISGSTISGGEPLMAMWAKGRQRLLPANGGFIDVSEAKNPVVIE